MKRTLANAPPLVEFSLRGVHHAPFKDYYDAPPRARDLVGLQRRSGGFVVYYGEKDRMVRAWRGYTSPRVDNVLEPEKLAAVADYLLNDGTLRTLAPYAEILRIDRELVDETQDAARRGRLWEYGIDRPFDRDDLGRDWIRVRDGNRRLFGAFAAGEPYGWVTRWNASERR